MHVDCRQPQEIHAWEEGDAGILLSAQLIGIMASLSTLTAQKILQLALVDSLFLFKHSVLLCAYYRSCAKIRE